ncbi:MAG: Rid family detoxifying hydrolase [Anaerolineales bacterium]|nr:Rid family detoxifying hydrolase [Anaerolineales bacterium]
MAEKQPILGGAKPIGPYTPAIRSGDFVFASGQIGLDPAAGALAPGGVTGQAQQMFTNLKNLLEAADAGMDGVVKTTLFLTDINDFAAVNEIYAQFFSEPYPARSTIQVAALPGGALVEIEAIARL